MVTEALGSGFSFSSSTLPDTKAAFFCPKAGWQIKIRAKKKEKAVSFNEKTFG
jgi:hypothetical protein